ncbi:XRE family transcriptional regulator [Martelella alba]|uniref:Helix-turn-helix transcriptional regulator n=1 Tax=Martelella alba TaxID=2590451 RepID=A0ABY2SFP5_9HYPH|nr:helix-turn-helix transcriptional regulator [Martelella alba]TKI03551.1 helix-turn-helix transcriptional regulator [Martelella alba]
MKNTTFSERLNIAMKESGFTQGALAESVGMAQPSVWKLVSGGAKGSKKTVQIAKVLGVRPEWLANGEEPMRAEGMTAHNPRSSIPPKSEWGTVDPWDDDTPLRDDEVEVPYLKDIEFACGDGRIMDEDHNGFMLRFSKSTLRKVGANTDGSGVLCFPARGDSMEPIIPDGTTVAIDTNNKRIIDGKLYAIGQPGGGNDQLKRIKQLYRRPGGRLVIHSFNGSDDEEAQESDVEIIGRVFWYSVLV